MTRRKINKVSPSTKTDRIIWYFKNHVPKDEAIDTMELVEFLELDRTTVSYHLNRMWKDGKIEKGYIGRTVYWYIKKRRK